jgi:hypothetical protein
MVELEFVWIIEEKDVPAGSHASAVDPSLETVWSAQLQTVTASNEVAAGPRSRFRSLEDALAWGRTQSDVVGWTHPPVHPRVASPPERDPCRACPPSTSGARRSRRAWAGPASDARTHPLSPRPGLYRRDRRQPLRYPPVEASARLPAALAPLGELRTLGAERCVVAVAGVDQASSGRRPKIFASSPSMIRSWSSDVVVRP